MPAGFAVNPNFAVVLPMMCHADEATAIERGIDGAHFFGYSLAHYYGMGTHQPGRTNVWEEFLENRDDDRLRAPHRDAGQGAARRQDHAGGPRLAARRDRHAGPGDRAAAPLRGRRRGPGHLRAPGRAPTGTSTSASSIELFGEARGAAVRRGARGPRAEKAEAPGAGHRARAGPPLAAAARLPRLCHRRAGGARAGRPRQAFRWPARARGGAGRRGARVAPAPRRRS